MAISIWDQGSNDFKLLPLTDENFKKAEETFGIKLPDSYLTILNEQNGGRIIYNAYPSSIPTAWGDTFIPVEYIKGIGSEDGILNNDYFLKEWNLPEGLILFSGDGHIWLAFDYRHIVVNPPIVYVDNELEQIIQIADNFDEFLNNLYIEELEVFKEDEYNEYAMKEYSEQDLEKLVQQNNLEEWVIALMQLSEGCVDMKWFSNQLLQLSNHPSELVRTEVARNVWNITYQLNDKTLGMLVRNFEKDTETNVQMFAHSIKEKMDYPFEQLEQDVKIAGMASFFYQNKIYHVNEHSNLWHLSDYQTDFQSFHSLHDLLKQATIEGKTLKELWRYVKKV